MIPENEQHKFQWKKRYTENKNQKKVKNDSKEFLPPLDSSIQSGIIDPVEDF